MMTPQAAEATSTRRERDGTMLVRRTAIKRQAEDAIRPMLQPGERTRAGAAVACGPSRSSGAWVCAVAIALVAEGLVGIFGPQPSLLSGGLLAAIGAGFPILAVHFAYRPMYIAVSDQRLIGLRLTRLGGAPGRLAFAAPLTDVRIRGHRSGRSRSSVRCEIRGRTRTRLNVERPWYPDFAHVTMELRHFGAVTDWDLPPYLSVANSWAADAKAALARALGRRESRRGACDPSSRSTAVGWRP